MTTLNSSAIDQTQIMKLIDYWANAVRTKDVDGRISNYSKNVKVFDVVEPLQYFGIDALRKRAEEWFSSFKGPIEYEMHDLRIATDSDVAFSYSLNHAAGTKMDGQRLDMWWRATVCYRRMDDGWTVMHEHNSVPFNPQTGRASLDLEPSNRS